MDFKKYAELMKVMNNYSSTFTQVQQIVDKYNRGGRGDFGGPSGGASGFFGGGSLGM